MNPRLRFPVTFLMTDLKGFFAYEFSADELAQSAKKACASRTQAAVQLSAHLPVPFSTGCRS